MSSAAPLIAAIEAGGTKFIVAVGTGPDDIRASTRIATTTPERTLREVIEWLDAMNREHGAITAMGVGSFGPVDLRLGSPTYGCITTTPKPGWKNTALVPPLAERFGVPVGFDTDVNAAALAEARWGAGQGIDPLVYLTIGTGIGGGVIVHGRPLHGVLHPEIGHIQVPAPRSAGVVSDRCQCPFHDACLEGYVSGPAIAARWGRKAEDLPLDHPAWREVAETLARGIVSLIVTLAPRRVIIGGGVMHQSGLLAAVRANVQRFLNGYLHVPEILDAIGDYIVAPGLGDRAGVCGALALGLDALTRTPQPGSPAAESPIRERGIADPLGDACTR